MVRNALLAVAAVAGIGLVAAESHGQPPPAAGKQESAKVQRGEYLVAISGCGDCHTPVKVEGGMPVPDMSRLLSGHPSGAPDPQGQLGQTDSLLVGPTFTSFKLQFGTVYAANLTPDKKTGMGNWTERDFVQAMRTGRHLGDASGRPILPPMPWMNLIKASNEDLSAMFAYLKTLKPIENAVPPPKVSQEMMQKFSQAWDKMKGASTPAPAAGGPKKPAGR